MKHICPGNTLHCAKMLLVYLPPECPLKLQFPVSKYLVIPFLLCWWKSWSIMPISHTFQSPRNYYSVICTGDHALLLRQPVSAKSIRFCRKAIARWSDFLMWLRFHIGKGGNEKGKERRPMMRWDARENDALLFKAAKRNESRRDLTCFVLQPSELWLYPASSC